MIVFEAGSQRLELMWQIAMDHMYLAIGEPNGFIRSYLRTAIWSSTDDDGDPFDSNYDETDFSPVAVYRAFVDCRRFVSVVRDWLVPACLIDIDRFRRDHTYERDTDIVVSKAAHDFWLTRNLHGCGFWDGDWRPDAEAAFIAAVKQFTEVGIYANAGRLYFE
jgi:hypothetical protein